MTIVATLNDGSYAGWGWGSSMDGTEMVIFSANGDSSSVGYYYSTGFTEPTADPSFAACYDSSFVNNGDGTVTLTASRPLECSETDFGGGSYVIQLDVDLALITAWNPDSPDLSFHSGNLLEFT